MEDVLQQVQVTPELSLSKAFADHWPKIVNTCLTSIYIEAIPTNDLRIEQSKFGGYPWLPENFDYPLDSEGVPMLLLAQLNFDEIPFLEAYPQTGILQFYISTSEDLLYGLDFDNMERKDGFKIVYFENTNGVNHKIDFPFKADSNFYYNSPLNQSHSLHFKYQKDYVGIYDVRYKSVGNFKIENWIEQLPEEVKQELQKEASEKFGNTGHKIGGYAYFTQWDPREDDQMILLFQMDSDEEIMWGDVGVGNFFIHPEDLKNRDFSNVLYNWDCG